MGLESWAGSINLETPAGRLLRQLVAVLPQDRDFNITVFGSAPIQIAVDAALTSADVDLFAEVSWGDGTKSQGRIEVDTTAGSGERKYVVQARHTYAVANGLERRPVFVEGDDVHIVPGCGLSALVGLELLPWPRVELDGLRDDVGEEEGLAIGRGGSGSIRRRA